MAEVLHIPAYAKVNLALNVMKRREDGYHELAMVMHPLTLADELVIERADSYSLEIIAPDPLVGLAGSIEENTITKSARLMEKLLDRPLPFSVRLIKRIPVAAGLGGGSSDAAAFLWAVRDLMELPLGFEELKEIALQIGADIPYCLLAQKGYSAVARGIGEELQILRSTKIFNFVVVNPGVPLSTAEVYGSLRPPFYARERELLNVARAVEDGDVSLLGRSIFNDLESCASHRVLEISQIIEELKGLGCVRAFVTGSGPTVVGLVSDRIAADRIVTRMKEIFPFVTAASSAVPLE